MEAIDASRLAGDQESVVFLMKEIAARAMPTIVEGEVSALRSRGIWVSASIYAWISVMASLGRITNVRRMRLG